MTSRVFRRAPTRFLAGVVGVYLLIGSVFAVAFSPEQVWQCPDPSAPHGYRSGNVKRSDDCTPTVSVGDRAQSFGALTVLWFPLVTAKVLVGD